MKIIEAKILKGTRDFLPKEMAKRQFVMNKMRDVFAGFGYDSIETPSIEYSETLLGKYGDEGNKLMYRFEDNGGRDIALRYDQTVPTARVVAANWSQLPMPFKRYQISRVWRADKPAKGRYREFYQCDIDIIGTESLLADAEIAKAIWQVYKNLGFENFVIKINSRRLMDAILDDVGIDDKDRVRVITLIDKLEKVGREAVSKQLMAFVDLEKANELLDILLLDGTNQEKLSKLDFAAKSEVSEFLKYCEFYGIPEENLNFDLSLARGLDYYTGIVYEVVAPDLDLGSLCGGGRYDNLCELFSKKSFPGVGVAFGFDRTILAMEELGLLDEVKLNSQVLVTNFGEEIVADSLEILNSLQEVGVNAEFYVEAAKLAKQFKYADRKQIPFVVVCGSEEIKKGEVTVKIMATGKQVVVPRSQLTSYLTGFSND